MRIRLQFFRGAVNACYMQVISGLPRHLAASAFAIAIPFPKKEGPDLSAGSGCSARGVYGVASLKDVKDPLSFCELCVNQIALFHDELFLHQEDFVDIGFVLFIIPVVAYVGHQSFLSSIHRLPSCAIPES